MIGLFPICPGCDNEVIAAGVGPSGQWHPKCFEEAQSKEWKLGQPVKDSEEVLYYSQEKGFTLKSTLPTDAKARKEIPLATGCFDYFPAALAAVANVSFVGNEQHNPGTPLHWDRSKSGDEADAMLRHFSQRGTIDSKNGLRHSAQMAWRALALLQKEIEAENA